MEQETVLVPEELVGVRLDKVLSELFSDLSRSYIQQLIKDQQVLINGKNNENVNNGAKMISVKNIVGSISVNF